MRSTVTRSRALLLMSFVFVVCELPAADNSGYHLTGIMGADPGMAFAVIEDADGQQKLLQEGSAIGNGYVKSISSADRIVVLAFPDGEVSLRLTGSGRSREAAQEESLLNDDNGQVEQKLLAPARLEKLATLADSAGTLEEKELAAQVNDVLGLAAQARVAAYNHRAVNSTHELLQRMGEHMAGMSGDANFLGSITVVEKGDKRRIYLSAGGPAD